jgi:hypothetical protein
MAEEPIMTKKINVGPDADEEADDRRRVAIVGRTLTMPDRRM